MPGKNKDTPLAVALKGLLSGAGGALALTAMVKAGRTVMVAQEQSTQGPPKSSGITAGEALSESPEAPPPIDEMTALFVQKVATGLFGATLDHDQQYVAGVAWHLTYGGFWGTIYSLIRSSLPLPRFISGPLYGLGVWALGPGWLVPKMKIMLPPTEQDRRTTLVVMAVHAAYGSLVATACHVMERRR
jgi:uncharacterized membrane protein YagU involved in acid resistance